MTRNKLVRILCITLVAVTLSLALILAVAVIGGTVAEGTPAESGDPHFRPFFPEGSFDIGDILDSLDPDDFTRDPDNTLPPEPEVSLPEWESGFEWPTLPPTLETDPDFELPTLPEDWETLPPEWDTLPEDWGDLPFGPDDLPFGPEDLGDLLAGMDGGLGMPPGALAAGVASQLTVMEIYAEHSDTLYLKMQSFGSFTGQSWTEAQAFAETFGGELYANYIPYLLMSEVTAFQGYPLTVTPKMDVRVIPYYIADAVSRDQFQTSDVRATGATDQPYTLYYRPYGSHTLPKWASSSTQKYVQAYNEFVAKSYLYVDETTMAYMKLIIEEQGFDPADPDIVQKVATYIQNAADYNLAYNQNLDQEPNVALAFLGAYKEGVCRHYATAATLLYRALGIPARYTVGFLADVEAGETTAVKGMDAHAWVEVYEKDFGWVPVEVTGTPSGSTPGGDPTDPPGTGTDTETTPGTGGDQTLPPVEPDTDPATWGDLMAGTKGGFAPMSGIPSSMWDSTVLTVTADHDGRLLLKLKSFGDYTGQGFNGVKGEEPTVYGYSAAYLTGLYLTSYSTATRHLLRVQTPGGTYAAPYYISPDNDPAGSVVTGDNRVTGNGVKSYEMYYYSQAPGFVPAEINAALYTDYTAYARDTFLTVDPDTAAYLALVSEEQGWDRMPTAEAIPAVAAYLRAHYTLTPYHDTALHDEENAVLAFMGAYREGTARHFAAAATLIYRTLGIPARYTVGYLAEVEADRSAKITGNQAYAWVEIYIEGIGWIAVDVAEYDPVTVKAVTLKPVELVVRYDGTTVSHNGLLEGFEAYAAQGYTYKAEVSGRRGTCGVSRTDISSVTIYDPQGKDVTKEFEITKKSGTLTVYLEELWFMSDSAEKVYDGTPLTLTNAYLTAGTLPEGYSVEFLPAKDGQTQAGTGYADYTVILWYDSGNGKLMGRNHYFIIHKGYGTHTVTPAALTVKANDGEKTYDGTPLTADGITITGGALAEGDYVDSYTVEGSQTRVGKSENTVTSIVIRNKDGEDVTGSYAIETVAGTLKVTAP